MSYRYIRLDSLGNYIFKGVRGYTEEQNDRLGDEQIIELARLAQEQPTTLILQSFFDASLVLDVLPNFTQLQTLIINDDQQNITPTNLDELYGYLAGSNLRNLELNGYILHTYHTVPLLIQVVRNPQLQNLKLNFDNPDWLQPLDMLQPIFEALGQRRHTNELILAGLHDVNEAALVAFVQAALTNSEFELQVLILTDMEITIPTMRLLLNLYERKESIQRLMIGDENFEFLRI